MLEKRKAVKKLGTSFVIGVTGHRNLHKDDLKNNSQLRKKVRQTLKQIREVIQDQEIVILSALAPGADQLVVKEARALNEKGETDFNIYVPLPADKKTYLEDFDKGKYDEEKKYFKKLWANAGETIAQFFNIYSKGESPESPDYKVLPEFLVKHSDRIIALWDGIYNAKITSKVVSEARETSHSSLIDEERKVETSNRCVHHILTPNEDNLFPVGTKYSSKKYLMGSKNTLLKKVKERIKQACIFIRKCIPSPKTDVGRFSWVGIIGLATIGFGTWGFYELYSQIDIIPKDTNSILLEAFFASAALLTLDMAYLHEYIQEIGWPLQLARFFGLLFPLLGISAGVYAAFNKQVKHWLVKAWRWRASPAISWIPGLGIKPHILICGLGWKGIELIKDFKLSDKTEGTEKNNKRKIVVIERYDTNPYIEIAEKLGALVLTGDATSETMLQKAQFQHAEKIYVVCGEQQDEINSRIAQQIVDVIEDNQMSNSPSDVYVELDDPRQRKLLREHYDNSGNNADNISLHTFDTYEITARELLEVYPVDRFYNSRPKNNEGLEAHLVVLGYSKMARAIINQVLHIGHFIKNDQDEQVPDFDLSLTILTENESEAKTDFFNRYPFLQKKDTSQKRGITEELRYDLIPWENINFYSLPHSDYELLSDESPLFKNISENQVVSVYCCLGEGLESAGMASDISKRLEHIKKEKAIDIQLFYYSDYPEEENKGQVFPRETTTPTEVLPIIPFGNFLERCSVESIEGTQRDERAREIAFFYYLIYDFSEPWANENLDSRIKDEIGKSIKNSEPSKKLKENRTELKNKFKLLKNQKEIEIAEKQEFAQYLYEIDGGKTYRELARQNWENESFTDQDSNRYAADHIPVKLRAWDYLGERYNLTEDKRIELLSRLEHRRWCAGKLINGWLPIPRAEYDYENKEWMIDKEDWKNQKRHSLLYSLRDDEFPDEETDKDKTQVEFILKAYGDKNE